MYLVDYIYNEYIIRMFSANTGCSIHANLKLIYWDTDFGTFVTFYEYFLGRKIRYISI